MIICCRTFSAAGGPTPSGADVADGGTVIPRHDVPTRTSQGGRFVLVIDRDGVSVSLPRDRRLAVWRGNARRRFGLVEVFAPRENWL